MSFSFSAIGTAAECAAQLASGETAEYGIVGARLAEALIEQLGDPETQPEAYQGGEYRYVVKASGHSGRSSTIYLNATVEAHWVPKAAVELAEVLAALDESAAAIGGGAETAAVDEG